MKIMWRNVRKARRAVLQNLTGISETEIKAALESVKAALIKSHEKIVEDWEHQPSFAGRKYVQPDRVGVVVFPTGEDKEIWKFVDQGTKPHPIDAKPGSRLVFFTSEQSPAYEPKTLAKPARTVRGGGYVKEPKVKVFAKHVDHPGSEGRHFTEAIARDTEPEFKRVMDNAFKRVAAKAKE
jgi:hypothetical protein